MRVLIGLPDVHAGYGFAIGNVAAFDMYLPPSPTNCYNFPSFLQPFPTNCYNFPSFLQPFPPHRISAHFTFHTLALFTLLHQPSLLMSNVLLPLTHAPFIRTDSPPFSCQTPSPSYPPAASASTSTVAYVIRLPRCLFVTVWSGSSPAHQLTRERHRQRYEGAACAVGV